MRTDAAPLGWGWTIRAVIGLIGLALAITSNTPRLRAQAGTVGEWKTLGVMPINPVHAALMNNGKVLIVSGSGNVAAETNFRSAVLDPLTGTIVQTSRTPVVGHVLQRHGVAARRPCVHQRRQPAIRPVLGRAEKRRVRSGDGACSPTLQNMAHGRWYPTVTTLGDGRVMTFSGLHENGATNTTVEIYNPSSGWSQRISRRLDAALYPRMHLLTDGSVFYSGSARSRGSSTLSTNTWSTVVATTNYTRHANVRHVRPSAVETARGYKAARDDHGRWQPGDGHDRNHRHRRPRRRSGRYGAPMTQPRIQMNATILPNGKVLATGGSTNDEDTTTASLNADLYDPVSNTFIVGGQNAYPAALSFECSAAARRDRAADRRQSPTWHLRTAHGDLLAGVPVQQQWDRGRPPGDR